MRNPIDRSGFTAPAGHALGRERWRIAVASLIASAALAFATVLVATVVSVGMAHADVVDNVIDNEGGLFAVALLLGLLFIGMGGLTILSLPHHLSLPGHKSKHPQNLA
jgi:hypothetical protein